MKDWPVQETIRASFGQKALDDATNRLCERCRDYNVPSPGIWLGADGMRFISGLSTSALRKDRRFCGLHLLPLTTDGEDCPYFRAPEAHGNGLAQDQISETMFLERGPAEVLSAPIADARALARWTGRTG